MNQSDLTRVLASDWDELTDPEREEAWDAIYGSVLEAARRERRRWDGDWTMETRAVANEVVLKLFGGDGAPAYTDRQHFYRVLCKAARQVLVDYARARRARKRGGDRSDLTFDEALAGEATRSGELSVIDLDRALTRLKGFDERGAQVVELRFFLGLEAAEAAEVLGVSKATVDRDWAAARAWLRRELGA